MLTTKEMAAKLNRSTTRVLQMIGAGKFPGATKKNGRTWLIPELKPKPAVTTAPTPSGKAKVATNKARAKGRVGGRPSTTTTGAARKLPKARGRGLTALS